MNRKLYLFGPVEADNIQKLMAKMIEYNNSDEEVDMYIQSDGGDIYCGIAVIELMQSVQYPINTIILGKAFSCAADIAVMGNKRYMTKNSAVMFHKTYYTEISGDIKTLEIESAESKRVEKLIDAALESKLGTIKFNKLKKEYEDGDFYLDYRKAKKFGVVDGLCHKKMFKNNE